MVDMDGAREGPGVSFDHGDHRPQRVAVEELPCSAFACSTNCPPLGLCRAQQRGVVSSRGCRICRRDGAADPEAGRPNATAPRAACDACGKCAWGERRIGARGLVVWWFALLLAATQPFPTTCGQGLDELK